ncbi:hypothetical protein V1525DRAFT_409245 [Lipomyces kononenkoae]|uniref:Uncharacterized protein n=1 Tax=Lipomyces kononenkoae TaxID=34357 RepID=A0ACC3SVK3_LIPKO
MLRLQYTVGYILVLITGVILVICLIPGVRDTTGDAVVNGNAAERQQYFRSGKHGTQRRNVQIESQPAERKSYVLGRTPGKGTPMKDRQGGRGWKQWPLLHDHGEEFSGAATVGEDARDKQILESLSRHKPKSPHIKRAVNNTTSLSSGSSSTTSISMTPSGGSRSSSDSASTIFSSIFSDTASSSSTSSDSSSGSLTLSSSSSDSESSRTSLATSTVDSSTATSTSEIITSESPVSTSVWTSIMRNSEGSAVSTVTETTIIYNVYSRTSALSASSAQVAPQLQTIASISEGTHRSAGYIAAKAAIVVVAMIWLL